jgi:hypothetical protein
MKPQKVSNLKTRSVAAFDEGIRNNTLTALVQDQQTIPKKLHVPKPVTDEYKSQLDIVEDGSLSLFKMPFGKNNFEWVIWAQGAGPEDSDEIFFSKNGVKIVDQPE